MLAGALCNCGTSIVLAYSLGWHPAIAGTAGAVVSVFLGAGYEINQNWGDAPEQGSVEDTAFDLSFWHLGTALGLLALIGA